MTPKPILLLLLALLPFGFLFAQFSTEFSEDEGYFDGDLTSNPNWAGSPDDFMVDTGGDGSMKIDPYESFRQIRYVGEGGVLTQTNIKVTMVFQVNFDVGESADVGEGAVTLGLIQIQNVAARGEFAGAALRQTSGAGPGTFNFFVVNKLIGENSADFCPMFRAADLGLAYDKSDGNWTDGESDPLELVHELNYGGDGWSEKASLTNRESGILLGMAEQVTADPGDSFLDNIKEFQINSGVISENPVTVSVDSLKVEVSK